VEYRILIFSNADLRREAVKYSTELCDTYALEAVAVLVAVMGVAARCRSGDDRKRELGLLRFLGATSGTIRRMILAEAGLFGLLANAAEWRSDSRCRSFWYRHKQAIVRWTIRFHCPCHFERSVR